MTTTTTTSMTTSTEPLPGLRCPFVDNPNNLIFFPHDTFCDRYFLCWNGGMIERTCTFGLIWDQQNRWCDFPENVFCPNMECPIPDDENQPSFLPNYSECNKYFMCFNGTKIPRTCANGLSWSRDKEWCDFNENVTCGLGGNSKVEKLEKSSRWSRKVSRLIERSFGTLKFE